RAGPARQLRSRPLGFICHPEGRTIGNARGADREAGPGDHASRRFRPGEHESLALRRQDIRLLSRRANLIARRVRIATGGDARCATRHRIPYREDAHRCPRSIESRRHRQGYGTTLRGHSVAVTDSWSLLTLQFAARFGDRSGARSWFVPGRIEVFGKHVDYAGGRSLLAAVDRGFHVLARPRSDNRVHLVDARSRQAFAGSLDAALPQQPGTWSDYPITVLRRIARDFPAARKGMDAVIMSTLPSAAGLSSSSALVIATFLPLVAFNALEQDLRFQEHCTPGPRLADYLGAVENGRAFGPFDADFGVGTQGGS